MTDLLLLDRVMKTLEQMHRRALSLVPHGGGWVDIDDLMARYDDDPAVNHAFLQLLDMGRVEEHGLRNLARPAKEKYIPELSPEPPLPKPRVMTEVAVFARPERVVPVTDFQKAEDAEYIRGVMAQLRNRGQYVKFEDVRAMFLERGIRESAKVTTCDLEGADA